MEIPSGQNPVRDGRSWLRKQASKQTLYGSTTHQAQREGCFCRKHARPENPSGGGSKGASAVGVESRAIYRCHECPECPEYPATISWNRHPPPATAPAAAGARANQHEQRRAKDETNIQNAEPAATQHANMQLKPHRFQSEIVTSQASTSNQHPSGRGSVCTPSLLQGRGVSCRVVSYQRHTPAVPLDNRPMLQSTSYGVPLF